MATMNMQSMPGTYDARWFIWTIVFLVVSGISLVSYITLSDSGTNDAPVFSKVQASSPTHKILKR